MSNQCIIFCIFFLGTYEVNSVCRNSNGMGTVLFTASDVHKQCWSPDEIAVLTTRMILEDILPDIQTLLIDSNDYVDDIVDYFRLLIELVRSKTHGRKKHVTLLALTDLLGGYLQHVVLPIARHAFYAGIIDYLSMEKLIQLFEEIKWFLRTNGQGWSKPIEIKTEHEIQPIDFPTETPKSNKSCCRNLIYYEHSPSKKRSTHSVYLPMPFFDSKVRPTAIAVPFKRYALRNIESKKASYIVMKYYISAYRCLQDLHVDVDTIHKFQNNLFTWVEKDVLPKLQDDKFYSAFGGVLRVEETLRIMGAKTTTEINCLQEEGEEEVGAVPGGGSNSSSSIFIMSMLSIIFLWFVIGTLFICYRIRKTNKKLLGGKPESGKKSDNMTTSTSFDSSRWSILSKSSTKRSTTDTCKCCTTPTEKSTIFSSSQSSDYDYKEETETSKKKERKASNMPVTYPQHKSSQHQSYNSPCMCGSPAIIETKHSMKVLPSIAEMSEKSTLPQEERNKSKRITFDEPLASSSRDFTQSRKKACVATGSDMILQPCPHYFDKETSLSRTKSGKEFGTQASAVEQSDVCWCPRQEGIEPQESLEKPSDNDEPRFNNAKNISSGGTTDDTILTGHSPHIYACHSSLTGNYTTNQKYSTEKPYIFGYDFQTSSSSEISDEDTDIRTSTSK